MVGEVEGARRLLRGWKAGWLVGVVVGVGWEVPHFVSGPWVLHPRLLLVWGWQMRSRGLAGRPPGPFSRYLEWI